LYIDGGLGKLARIMSEKIEQLGGEIFCGENITKIRTSENKVVQVLSKTGRTYSAKKFIFTGAPSQLKSIMETEQFPEWIKNLDSIKYLGNVCLILLLDRSLSETYWLNVNDPGFPFVGVIEHTNLVSEKFYGDLHVVYLSRYIADDHRDYRSTDKEYLSNSLKSLKLMFPDFNEDWIKEFYVWRSPFAQPITSKNYSKIKPDLHTPFSNLFLNTMAQIYPEDRGTNYAVRNAESLAKVLLEAQDDILPNVLTPKSNLN
jgi:protoporphyrinogen oxidase